MKSVQAMKEGSIDDHACPQASKERSNHACGMKDSLAVAEMYEADQYHGRERNASGEHLEVRHCLLVVFAADEVEDV